MKTPIHIIPIICAASILCGCATVDTRHTLVVRPIGDKTVLLLPVLTSNDTQIEAGRQMTEALRRECTAQLGNQVVFAGSLRHLQDAITADNLRKDGQIAEEEIRTLTDVIDCDAAVLFDLVQANPYAPQKLAGNLLIIPKQHDQSIQQHPVTLDLANHNTLDAYNHYLERVQAFRIGNLESETADRIHTAMLSPRTFRQFAAHSLIRALAAGMNSAASKTSSDGPTVTGNTEEAEPERVLDNRGRDMFRKLQRQ